MRVRQPTQLCSRQVGREAEAQVREDVQLSQVAERLPEQREVALVARRQRARQDPTRAEQHGVKHWSGQGAYRWARRRGAEVWAWGLQRNSKSVDLQSYKPILLNSLILLPLLSVRPPLLLAAFAVGEEHLERDLDQGCGSPSGGQAGPPGRGLSGRLR